MEKQDAVAVWMKRAALAGILVLLGLMCLLVWRLSVLVADVNRNVSALSGDVRQVTQVAAGLSNKVEEAAQRLNGIENITQGIVQSDTISGAAERAGQAIQDYAIVAPVANETARAEIAHLLACIRDPKLNYEYSGKSRTAAWVALKLNGKYAIYQHSVVSAEDFVQKIAAKTSEGDAYYVVQPDGSKTELAAYLTRALEQYRASKGPAGQSLQTK